MNTSDDMRDKIAPQPAFQPSIDLLIWVIIAVQVIVAVYGFAVLPDMVPMHWNFNGHTNGYGPKWLGMFLYPLISIGISALMRVLTTAGPRLGGRENTEANVRIWKIIVTGIVLFLLITQLATIAQALSVGFDITMVETLALSVLFLFLGNYLGKVRRNFWMGIRTPWTLASSVVWERTHRLGGWLFVAAGLLGILCSFIPALHLRGILALVIVVGIFLYIYSYTCYQRVTREQDESLSPPFDREN